MSTTAARPIVTCRRCNGSGTVAAHSNVLGGMCFGCRGTGLVRAAAPRAARRFVAMTQWPSGEVQIAVIGGARGGESEDGDEVTFTVCEEHISDMPLSRINDDTDEARANRARFRAVARRYGTAG